MSAAETLVDARGLLCPWPVLRLSRAARELNGNGRVLLLADDPMAASEVAQLCAQKGWSVEQDPERTYRFLVLLS